LRGALLHFALFHALPDFRPVGWRFRVHHVLRVADL
jgi:hypothetical protein